MNQKRLVIAGAALALLVIAVVIRLMLGSGPARPAPSASGYYTGPMVNKSGTAVTTEDGKIVRVLSPEAGAKAPEGGSSTEGGVSTRR